MIRRLAAVAACLTRSHRHAYAGTRRHVHGARVPLGRRQQLLADLPHECVTPPPTSSARAACRSTAASTTGWSLATPAARAPRAGLTNASVFFDAPAGARIVRVNGQIIFNGTAAGWRASTTTAERWLWCGTRCLSTFGHWVAFNIGGLSTGRVSAIVICANRRMRPRRPDA